MHAATRLVCALLLPLGSLAMAPLTSATAADADQPGKLMLVLDSSGSMKESIGGGQTRIKAAREGLLTVIDSLPEDQEVGLRVYGAEVFSRDDKGACTDSQRVVDLGTDNRGELRKAATAYKPYGETPIGYALQQAGKDLGSEGQRTIVLVSDGEPTCDPDPCKVAEQLSKNGIKLKIDVVGLDVSGKARDKLQCIAEAGHGTYYDADDAASLSDSLTTSSTRSSRPFDLTGIPVEGTADAASAPTITTGQYLDTIPLNDGLWYKIERTAKYSTVHVGVTHLSDGIGNAGNTMSVETYADPTSLRCDDSLSFALGRLGFAGASTWKKDPADECNVADTIFVHVEPRLSAAELTGQPIEVAVYEEPPLADPTGRELTAAPQEPEWSTLDAGKPETEVVPGTSISNAPVVADGSYALDINPGEAQVLAIPVGWGQNVQAQFDAKLTEEITDGGGDGPSLQFLGPVRDRGSVDFYGSAPDDWTTAAWGNLRYGDDTTFRTGAQTRAIGYLNRASNGAHGADVAGLRYVQVSYDAGDDAAPLDYTLTLKTNGSATGGPEYRAVDGLRPPEAASPLVSVVDADRSEESIDAASDNAGGGVPWMPIAAGVAAIILLTGLAVVVLRGRRSG